MSQRGEISLPIKLYSSQCLKTTPVFQWKNSQLIIVLYSLKTTWKLKCISSLTAVFEIVTSMNLFSFYCMLLCLVFLLKQYSSTALEQWGSYYAFQPRLQHFKRMSCSCSDSRGTHISKTNTEILGLLWFSCWFDW